MGLPHSVPFRACGAVIAVLLINLAGDARAQAPEAGDARNNARRLLAEAQAHEEDERFALAAERYLEMHRVLSDAGMERAPVALYSAGNALARVPGREVEARRVLQKFLDDSTSLTDDPQVRDWRSSAVELVGELTARLPPAPREELDIPTPLDSSGSPDPPPQPPAGSGISPVGPVVLGIGGAALNAGLVLAAVGAGQDQDLIDRCPTRTGCDPSLQPDVESTRTLGLAGDVLWIGGATVVATGLLLLFVLDGSDPESPSVSATAAISRRSAGVVVSGRLW